MEEKTIKNIEQTMNDSLDMAFGAGIESEDREKHIKQAIALGNVLNDSKKLEYEKEIEMAKIDAQSHISEKDLFVVGTPIVAGGVGLVYKSKVLKDQLKAITNFERLGTYSSSAGRFIVGTLRDIFRF